MVTIPPIILPLHNIEFEVILLQSSQQCKHRFITGIWGCNKILLVFVFFSHRDTETRRIHRGELIIFYPFYSLFQFHYINLSSSVHLCESVALCDQLHFHRCAFVLVTCRTVQEDTNIPIAQVAIFRIQPHYK